MTGQELDQHSKIQKTKAKGYILLKKGQRRRQKALSFLHKGIINNNSFTLELLSINNIITSQKTDRGILSSRRQSRRVKMRKIYPA